MKATKNGNGNGHVGTNRIAELADTSSQVSLKPIRRMRVLMTIIGTSPLIQHAWSVKAREMMREKHAGKKTKNREVRNPEAEGFEAAYRTPDGRWGIPAMALKSSIINAAHKDIGCEKTLVRKALFIVVPNAAMILPMDCDEPVIQEDCVRVGMGSADLRYRPYYHRWSVDVKWEIDAELLTVTDLCNLVDRAGFGVGIGEWRPEKGGDYGRFQVDRTKQILVAESDD